jgi:hypothetical protein
METLLCDGHAIATTARPCPTTDSSLSEFRIRGGGGRGTPEAEVVVEPGWYGWWHVWQERHRPVRWISTGGAR